MQEKAWEQAVREVASPECGHTVQEAAALGQGQAAGQEEGDFSLDEAFDELEQVVKALEQEDISLEESFRIYKGGMELLKKCNKAIDQVEKKVLALDDEGETYEF